jgi:hypothetical protein
MRQARSGDAFEWLFNKVRELDTMDPARRGVHYTLAKEISAEARRTITLSLENVPAQEALNYMTELLNLSYIVDMSVVQISAIKAEDWLLPRYYVIPPEAINVSTKNVRAPNGKDYETLQDLFSAFGVTFPSGAAATIGDDHELVLRNTAFNLAIANVVVAAIIDAKGKELTPLKMQALERLLSEAKSRGRIRDSKGEFLAGLPVSICPPYSR